MLSLQYHYHILGYSNNARLLSRSLLAHLLDLLPNIHWHHFYACPLLHFLPANDYRKLCIEIICKIYLIIANFFDISMVVSSTRMATATAFLPLNSGIYDLFVYQNAWFLDKGI